MKSQLQQEVASSLEHEIVIRREESMIQHYQTLLKYAICTRVNAVCLRLAKYPTARIKDQE